MDKNIVRAIDEVAQMACAINHVLFIAQLEDITRESVSWYLARVLTLSASNEILLSVEDSGVESLRAQAEARYTASSTMTTGDPSIAMQMALDGNQRAYPPFASAVRQLRLVVDEDNESVVSMDF